MEDRAREKNLDIYLDMMELPEAMVSDAVKLRQILMNLISNAIKFTEVGFVKVEAKVSSAHNLVVTVQDTGIGIAQSDWSLIFNRFTQVDNGLARNFEGAGIGLALSKNLAQLLGGDLTIAASEQNQGSTFKLEIPMKINRSPEKQVPEKEESGTGDVAHSEAFGTTKSIEKV